MPTARGGVGRVWPSSMAAGEVCPGHLTSPAHITHASKHDIALLQNFQLPRGLARGAEGGDPDAS